MAVQTQPVEILLVEDNEDDIVYFEEVLIGSKILNTVHVAHDGEDAMAFLRKEGRHRNAPTPNLIFLDIKLPKKDGFDVLREMHADSALRQIPVFMLTTSENLEDEYQSFMQGARGYLNKPAAFDRLFRALQSMKIYWSLVTIQPTPA